MMSEGFSSSKSQIVAGDKKFTLRVLKMQDSTMLFLSNQMPECFDEMAVAMPMDGQTKEVIATTVLGDHMRLNSQRLAEKLSKRFNRPFIVSYNAEVDRITNQEEHLVEYIRNHKDEFV